MGYIIAALIIAVLIVAIKNIPGSVHSYEQYEHYGVTVWVRSDLKGKHRDYCLCWKCDQFHPGQVTNCPIAQILYQNCVTFDIVTPVWECPKFSLVQK